MSGLPAASRWTARPIFARFCQLIHLPVNLRCGRNQQNAVAEQQRPLRVTAACARAAVHARTASTATAAATERRNCDIPDMPVQAVPAVGADQPQRGNENSGAEQQQHCCGAQCTDIPDVCFQPNLAAPTSRPTRRRREAPARNRCCAPSRPATARLGTEATRPAQSEPAR